MIARARKRLSASEVATGAYLTDGVRLVQVVGATDGSVLLEDVKTLDAEWKTVTVLTRASSKWRRVIPLPAEDAGLTTMASAG